MILKNRQFTRKDPTRDPKVIIIYSEGKKTEPNYFRYFESLSSKIHLEIIPATQCGNNSPPGLFEKAENDIHTETPKYQIDDSIDEVWFVIDTDTWGCKISELREMCAPFRNWFICQSNPCFEVWLYYHFKEEKPNFEGMEISSNWKKYVNEIIPGGFDKRKHPKYIRRAIEHSEKNYKEINKNIPDIGSTQNHLLAKSFYTIIEEKLNTT
jgi:hypothetical protein